MELNICHLYPDILNLYGDRGNIITMKRRLESRGISVNVDECSIGQPLDVDKYDIFFIGGGQDFEQEVLLRDLASGKGKDICTAVEEEKVMQIEQTELLMAVFGAFDENIKQIERELNVSVISRGTELKITGEDEGVSIAARAITALLAMAGRGESIGTQTVQYVIGLAKDGRESEVHTMSRDVLCITAKGKPVKAKTLGQKKYMEAIRKNTIVMGVGPAGTGKTYLAVAAAVAAFRDKQVSRIILTRPAVEAGERLGFLPGDLQSKVDPYLRPLYDADVLAC